MFLTSVLRQVFQRGNARGPENAPAARSRAPRAADGPELLIVVATRVSAEDFLETTPLGRSLRRLSFVARLDMRLAFLNRDGLPVVYNRQINEENREKILLFVHDDVWLDDCFVKDRLVDALKAFDVVGVAGNTRRVPQQPGWAFTTHEPFTWDDQANLAGAVAHGKEPCGVVNSFGPPGPRACKLLDGVLLAARCRTLLDSGVRFDERFTFDFYDIDFCRSAELANLRMGTWPISITHASDGKFGSPGWQAGLQSYREKWKD